MLPSALEYASRGWPVFPLEPRGKRPESHLVSHGVLEASTDPASIRAWWRACPQANIGLATGPPGPDVLDIDTKDGRPGLSTLGRLQAAGLLAGVFRRVRTPSGGLHLYLSPSGEGNHARARLGLDYRGAGGYVVAPPSCTQRGAWELVADGDDPEMPFDWAAAMALLDPPRERAPLPRTNERDTRHLVRFVLASANGERNARLFWAACRAVEDGGDLRQLAEAAVQVGLSQREITATLRSARRRE